MRMLPSIILCLFMALCVLANDDLANDNSASDDVTNDDVANDDVVDDNSANDNATNTDFVLGERKENDYLAYTKFYSVSKDSRLRTFKIPVLTRSHEVITQIKLHNTGTGTQLPTITVLKEFGQRFLLLRAERQADQAISMSMEVYVLRNFPSCHHKHRTTQSPVTTPSPTTVPGY